jgi:glycosyltransferase involved in cell wall biosynthesis
MICFDTTKTGAAKHRSGLMRVSERLRKELGAAAVAVRWPELPRDFGAADWFVTAELFSEAERPGFSAWLESGACRTAAIFHDAIPLRFPQITWPQSVARHPGYMKLLAGFDRVLAVSHASKADLEGFWRWQGLGRVPPVDVLALGANFSVEPRRADRHESPVRPLLLSVGILEPRKNQPFLLDICDALWRRGRDFELHLVGRVNPHFGKPIVARIKALARAHRGRLVWHGAPDDAVLLALYRRARATVFPTIAEGCGLPLLESLWMGVPCVCSDLPVLRENAGGGGCVPVGVNSTVEWLAAVERVVADDAFVAALSREAVSRRLPTWADTAQQLQAALR